MSAPQEPRPDYSIENEIGRQCAAEGHGIRVFDWWTKDLYCVECGNPATLIPTGWGSTNRQYQADSHA